MLKKFIVGTQVFFLVWLISIVVMASCETKEYVGACEGGIIFGAFLTVFLWAMVNFILLVIWIVTKKNK